VTGCFVLGVLLTLIVERWPPSRYVRAFTVVGFLGAYTTFSTYTVEAVTLSKDGHVEIAAAYVVSSLVVGLAAVYAGMTLARLPVFRREVA
jgi:CrcB protein